MGRRPAAAKTVTPAATTPTLLDVASDRIPKLQHRLILVRYFTKIFGAESFTQLRERLKDVRIEYQDDGLSRFYHTLCNYNALGVTEERLAEYDRRIRGYVDRMNKKRNPQVRFPYYQWLALLFSEAYFERLFTKPDTLLAELNELVKAENAKVPPRGWTYPEFTENDLTKIAFWMATGSGKTLLMHANLWQYEHYQSQAKDEAIRKRSGTLLITPNEGLTKQHLEEFRKSGIAATRHGDTGSGLYNGEEKVVVIEITKLTLKKRGSGVSVDTDEFENFGLILVDEGHRGASGEAWRALRAKVGEGSLTIEYSATFGQIVNGATAAKKKLLLPEYTRSILFDYSYPHFYEDGYGKEYSVLNSDSTAEENSDFILLGNLLSFYEQQLAFRQDSTALQAYNLEAPLWVFVGNSVTGSTDDDLTDVQEVVGFFDRFLKQREGFTSTIDTLLSGKSGMKNASGQDLFDSLYPLLRERGFTPGELYEGIVQTVFQASPGETLHAAVLKSAPGEIGLKAGAAGTPFGVINIGDVAGLREKLKGQGITIDEENIAPSLFDVINKHGSPINVLIGSRKFMEGWDSFRVSSMGLMNIGRGEGSQIVQLFGRGVRLRGKGFSLTRSSRLKDEGTPPANIELLETLTIFGVRASYMAQFRTYLKEEGIEDEFEEIEIPIRFKPELFAKGLRVPRVKTPFTAPVCAFVDPDISVKLDLLPKYESASSKDGLQEAGKVAGDDRADWVRRHATLLDTGRLLPQIDKWRRDKGLVNLALTPTLLREILAKAEYIVLCPEGYFEQPKTALSRLETVARDLCTAYLAKFYDRARRRWDMANLEMVPLDENDPNVKPEQYTLKVRADKTQTIAALRNHVAEAKALYEHDLADLPNVHIDQHLYLPLLTDEHSEIAGMKPAALEKSESKFLRDLRETLRGNTAILKGAELILLRNQSLKGVVFYAASGEGFYPDFILWLLDEKHERIVFVDPHGIRQDGGITNPKVTLFADLEERSASFTDGAEREVKATSFIVAPGNYRELHRSSWVRDYKQEQMEASHILFNEDSAYIIKLLGEVLSGSETAL